jgi:DNA (cytosine-5)-methyltransferase 3A
MKVLSLFDGISAGQLALQRAGVAVETYYASEVDRYAISVTDKNFPNTIQLGDVTKWREWDIPWGEIDLVIGGSPCQGFSFAGKQLNFNDPRSALFFVFVDICHRVADENPKMRFMLENVRMKKEYQDVISGYFGVDPIAINSSLVSAQNRYRLYWTNIPNVTQPNDKGILLRDILQDNVDAKHYLSDKAVDKLKRHNNKIIENLENPDKSSTIHAGYYKMGGRDQQYVIDDKYYLTPEAIDYMSRLRNGKPRWEYHTNNLDGKSACLTANMHKGVPYGVLRIPEATKKGYTEVHPNEGVDLTFINSKTRRGRLMKEKSNCLTATNYDYCWYDGYICRKLTPIECERLQTFPDNWTEGISNSQRYKALGNSWTVDVVTHIFKNL